MVDQTAPLLPQAIITADMVERAMKAALSSTAVARKLPYPSEYEMAELLAACIIVQSHVHRQAEREKLESARNKLYSSLKNAKEAADTMDAILFSFEKRPLQGDIEYDFLQYKDLPDKEYMYLRDREFPEDAKVYDDEMHAHLAKISVDLETMLQGPAVTNPSHVPRFERWRLFAPGFADICLTTFSSIDPGAGRLKLPPHFMAAMIPHITGEKPSPGTVKEALANKKKPKQRRVASSETQLKQSR